MTKFLRRMTGTRPRSFPRGMLVIAFLAASFPVHPAGAVLPPRHGSTLIVAARGPVTTIDPARATTTAERDLVAALFDRLVTEGPDGDIVAAAASSWTASADSTEWTFVLRHGLRFSNGRPVTAADVVASWARLAAIEHPAPTRSLVGAVRGRAVDGRTLVVEIDPHRPAASPPDVFADPLFSIVLVVNGPGGESLLGSGPFRFGGQADGGFVLLPRLDHPLGRPAPSRVLISPYPDDAAGMELLGGLAAARHDESTSTAGRAPLEVEPELRGLRRTAHGVLDLTLAFLLR